MGSPMTVFADAAFVIGQSHTDTARPCQDYALAGQMGADCPVAWAAVSDGCSSAGRTDIGARMWVQAAAQWLESQPHEADAQRESPLGMPASDVAAEMIDLAAGLLRPFERRDGLATLGLAVSDGCRARALLFGDGVVAARSLDGRTTVWTVEYELNAPRYLGYRLPRKDGTDDEAAWVRMVAHSLVLVRCCSLGADGHELDSTVVAYPAATFPALDLTWSHVGQLQCVLVATDGALSFGAEDPMEAVKALLAVKSPAGEFMHRRLGAMARGWRRAAGGMPQDDLAAAMLWLGGGSIA